MFEQINYEKYEKINRAVDAIRKKYGEDSVIRARFVKNDVKSMSGGLDKGRRTGITTGIRLDKEIQM